jgi:glycine betaine/choline ABC-type transport system substrate-binding protein
MGVTKISELAPHMDGRTLASHFSFFSRPDGLPRLRESYGGFRIRRDQALHSEIYNELREGRIDAAIGYGTDPETVLGDDDFVQLEDDRACFGNYYGFPLYNTLALEIVPDLEDVLAPLAGTIDNRIMAELIVGAREANLQELDLTVSPGPREIRRYVRSHLDKLG